METLTLGYESKMQNVKDEVEALVDKYTLATLLEALGLVCIEKADHIRSQDSDHPNLVFAWSEAGKSLGAHSYRVRGL